MMTPENLMAVFGVLAAATPLILFAVLAIGSLIPNRLSEPTVANLCQAAVVTGLLCCLCVLAGMLLTGSRHFDVANSQWVEIPKYHFSINLVFDRLSVPFAILSFTLVGTVGAFTRTYLHREPGYHRFYVLYSLFLAGMVLASLAGTIETLFVGWELVGLSSALLVAYFHERSAPVRNGFRVWAVYRISDAALLTAAVVMHHMVGQGEFFRLAGEGIWPEGQSLLTPDQALLVGSLLLVAAAGKSALLPFSGWLPRAMEGPTTSSAIFYGALSVHLGTFLLLRISPILDQSWILSGVVVALGLSSAIVASLVGRVQTDIKSALAYASLTQVGIIFVEIGLGLRYIALIHILGHACLRTLQFLRAPNLLNDYHWLKDAMGDHVRNSQIDRRPWMYRFLLERAYLDGFLNDYVARPFLNVFRWFDSIERGLTDALSGGDSRRSDRVKPSVETIEELP